MTGTTSTTLVAEEPISNKIFLLPNGTFFFEFILFVVVFLLFVKFIVPPIRQAMSEREERVRQAQRDKEEADRQYAQAQRKHQEVLHEARSSAASIRDEARSSAREGGDELKAQAEREVASVRERGERQLAEQRSGTWSQLTEQLPTLSTGLAERILGRRLSGDHSGTVREYIGSMGSRGGSGAASRGTATPTASVGSAESGAGES